MSWMKIGKLEEIPRQGARVVKTSTGDIAVFRTLEGEVFALRDRCPHRGGPLSQGIVHGTLVTCPLHGWRVNLDTGKVEAPDEGCAAAFPTRIVGDEVELELGDRLAEAGSSRESCP